MSDALNRRLHDRLTAEGPAARAARDQMIRAGDIIISRTNDSRIPVRAAVCAERHDPDEVRNGHRWRAVGVDQQTNRVSERLSDNARVAFDGDYLREHVYLGYAVTVHSAQGVTADTCHTVIGQTASRALAYVAMSRGRHGNHAYIYTRFSGEADHEHTGPVAGADMHVMQRGTKYSAAHYFRMILANDDRPRTMHAEAEHTDREQLPEIVGRLLDRHDARRAARRQTWREQTAAERAFYERYDRLADDIGRTAERGMDRGYGLEL